jgi:hypothetical protein
VDLASEHDEPFEAAQLDDGACSRQISFKRDQLVALTRPWDINSKIIGVVSVGSLFIIKQTDARLQLTVNMSHATGLHGGSDRGT